MTNYIVGSKTQGIAQPVVHGSNVQTDPPASGPGCDRRGLGKQVFRTVTLNRAGSSRSGRLQTSYGEASLAVFSQTLSRRFPQTLLVSQKPLQYPNSSFWSTSCLFVFYCLLGSL